MDFVAIKEKGTAFLKKYKYIALILIVGIILMLLPSGETGKQPTVQTKQSDVSEINDVSDRLSELLAMVDGAGSVRVMLTVSQGQQTVYQTDTQGDTSWQTVIITDSARNEAGLIKQVNAPVYQGAVVLCQGADDPQVRLAITEAISKATGLGANQIAVLKMK